MDAPAPIERRLACVSALFLTKLEAGTDIKAGRFSGLVYQIGSNSLNPLARGERRRDRWRQPSQERALSRKLFSPRPRLSFHIDVDGDSVIQASTTLYARAQDLPSASRSGAAR